MNATHAKKLVVLALLLGAIALTGCATQQAAADGPPRAPAAMSDAANEAPAPDIARVGGEIETAHHTDNTKELQVLRTQLAQFVVNRAQAGKYAWYYLGYVNFALADLNVHKDSGQFDDYIDDAEYALDKVTRIDPDFAEAYALLGVSYMIEISQHLWKAPVLGMKAGHATGRAFALAPSNPRVMLFKAFSDYNTPAMFGGDKEAGLREYRKAVQLFDSYQPRDPNAPRWGKALALRWLADVELLAGEQRHAKTHFEAALELAPGYKSVQQKLATLKANMKMSPNDHPIQTVE